MPPRPGRRKREELLAANGGVIVVDYCGTDNPMVMAADIAEETATLLRSPLQ